MKPAREKCSVQICPADARRTVFGDRYCGPCAASVEQAAYFLALPIKAAEAVRYRGALAVEPPEGVTLPEPIAAAPQKAERGAVNGA